MDEFGWTETEAVFNWSLIIASTGVVAFASYSLISWLSKRWTNKRTIYGFKMQIVQPANLLFFRFQLRTILIFGGLIGTMVVRILMFPLPGGDHPPTPSEDSGRGGYLRNQDCELTNGGAPLCTHDWCKTQPAINLGQHITVVLLATITYSICQGVMQSLVSKILGPRPQVLKVLQCFHI